MNPPPRPTRRQLFAGTAVVLVAASSGCTGPPPADPPPDPLAPLLAAAEADAALAEAVAAGHPGLAVLALTFAADRRAHAERIGAEIRRATPSPSPAPSSPVAGPAAVVAPADPVAAATALGDAARAAQAQAGGLVGGLPRHRAGLAASVAACCASHLAVLA